MISIVESSTETANVASPDVAPPLRPSPATTDVISPATPTNWFEDTDKLAPAIAVKKSPIASLLTPLSVASKNTSESAPSAIAASDIPAAVKYEPVAELRDVLALLAVNEFNDVFKIESPALSPSLLNDSVEPSKSTDKVEPPPPAIPLPCDATLKFSEPSASKPVPAKSHTSISKVIVESPAAFNVNEPPVFKPSPAVNVIVESLTLANSETCEDEDTIPEPLKSNELVVNSTFVLPPWPRMCNFLASVS